MSEGGISSVKLQCYAALFWCTNNHYMARSIFYVCVVLCLDNKQALHSYCRSCRLHLDHFISCCCFVLVSTLGQVATLWIPASFSASSSLLCLSLASLIFSPQPFALLLPKRNQQRLRKLVLPRKTLGY